MRKLTIVILLFLAICCPPVAQAGKVTVDPNAGPAASSENSRTDPRLAQKISCEEWHTLLKSILADLSQKTGVTLKAGYNDLDWQVRDRRMNILVKDVTLARLMNSIARVMKFKWSINNKTQPPTYRLIADRRLLAKLQAEASRREQELKTEEMKRRTEPVDSLAEVADTSGADLESLKESNPYPPVRRDGIRKTDDTGVR